MSRRPADRAGFTLLELVIVVAIVGILAAVVLPVARWSIKRNNEHELQQSLRIIRNAIDRYHDLASAGLIDVADGDSGYPPDLETLVEGVELTGALPSPLPGVSDVYAASGAGLTGGFAGADQGAPGFDPGGAAAIGPRAAQRESLASSLGQLQDPRSPLAQRLSPSQRGELGRLAQGLRGGGLAGRSSGGFGGRGARGAGGGVGVAAFDRRADLGAPEKIVFLRRLPIDPMTGSDDWGMRCYGDDIEDRSWCGRNVFDVYTTARGTGIDGRPYRVW